MSGTPKVDRRTRRRQETVEEIVAAAWEQVRERGLTALSMQDLDARVGMRADQAIDILLAELVPDHLEVAMGRNRG